MNIEATLKALDKRNAAAEIEAVRAAVKTLQFRRGVLAKRIEAHKHKGQNPRTADDCKEHQALTLALNIVRGWLDSRSKRVVP